ncbi:MAG: tRNA lysidine(34) synthetase TilS [Clostridia bacterium]|nr:tRNA lysidine(34) synthetase TilS [Clostridia bacterium]
MPSSFNKTKYLDTVSRYGMLKEGTSVLVGFSGGADSSLLLSLLSQTDGITVAAAHLNHGIRGEEALRDEYFCRRFCDENNIALYVKRVDVPKLAADGGLGIEEAARNARYEFFNDVCAEHGYDVIATAHNADDNLETVLFHLVRGTGLDGLCGIPPVRDNIIRPIIQYSKEEIFDGCREYGIPFVTDSTNNDTTYSRNYIRREIIPKLKELNPSLCESVTGSVELLKRDACYLNEIAREHSLSEGRQTLSALPDPILSRVLLYNMKENDITVERSRINEMMMAIRSRSAHISISLCGATFVCDRDLVYFINESKSNGFCFPLKMGLNVINENTAIGVYPSDISSEKDIINDKNIYKLSIQAKISSAKINNNTVIRSRKNGDVYRQGGMTRKVKKLIQSLKLPKAETDILPFIESDGEIIYVPYFKPADSAQPDGKNDLTVVYFIHRSEK